MESHDLRAERESWLVGKVCDLYRVLETGNQSCSRLRAAVGSSLIRRTLFTYMIMVNNDGYKYDSLVFPLGGSAFG